MVTVAEEPGRKRRHRLVTGLIGLGLLALAGGALAAGQVLGAVFLAILAILPIGAAARQAPPATLEIERGTVVFRYGRSHSLTVPRGRVTLVRPHRTRQRHDFAFLDADDRHVADIPVSAFATGEVGAALVAAGWPWEDVP